MPHCKSLGGRMLTFLKRLLRLELASDLTASIHQNLLCEAVGIQNDSMQEHIESLCTLPKARIRDLFQSKNFYAVVVRNSFSYLISKDLMFISKIQMFSLQSEPDDVKICVSAQLTYHKKYNAQVGVGLMIFQQLGGINALGFYASYIFTLAGFSGKLGTTLIGIIQIPITFLGALLMDKSGRRALLMVSASGTFLGCFLTGLSFYFKAQELYTELVPSFALYGILVYYVAYSIGMGPVPWVIMSEIFSIDMKAIAGGLVTLVCWIGSFTISYSFNFLMDWNSAGTFFLFSAASLITVLFVARLVPETKGRTLKEIQESLNANT